MRNLHLIVTNHFKEVFQRREEERKDIEPTAMKRPFTQVEIRNSVSRWKNNKSTGIGDISAEMIKYRPKIVYQEMADIFNKMANTGNIPDEVIEGVLVPLPKPGKPQGPPTNVRSIILLSILRKILAICMIKRIQGKLKIEYHYHTQHIEQEEVQLSMSSLVKILAEKAITLECYETTILLLDMSKAFDTIEKKQLNGTA